MGVQRLQNFAISTNSPELFEENRIDNINKTRIWTILIQSMNSIIKDIYRENKEISKENLKDQITDEINSPYLPSNQYLQRMLDLAFEIVYQNLKI